MVEETFKEAGPLPVAELPPVALDDEGYPVLADEYETDCGAQSLGFCASALVVLAAAVLLGLGAEWLPRIVGVVS